MNVKLVKAIHTAAAPHMVGDGFKVRNFIGRDLWEDLSPFLMLDYNEPWHVLPTNYPRGVDVHPHKGFETVSIVWQGRVAHEDSSGGKGEIGAGDVQWMTAGSGILHKEYHASEFSKTGGVFHMAQLWVNLPAAFKNTLPAYQDLLNENIAQVQLPNEGGRVRVIAGEFDGVKGAAKTFTRLNLFDINLNADGICNIHLPEGDSASIVVLSGNVIINDKEQVRTGQMVVFAHNGTNIQVESNNEAHLLVLSGQPIAEPIAAYGPFVMNTKAEITEAIHDFNAGKFGLLQ